MREVKDRNVPDLGSLGIVDDLGGVRALLGPFNQSESGGSPWTPLAWGHGLQTKPRHNFLVVEPLSHTPINKRSTPWPSCWC